MMFRRSRSRSVFAVAATAVLTLSAPVISAEVSGTVATARALDSVVATVPVGAAPTAVVVSPDSRHVYIAESTIEALVVVDAADFGLQRIALAAKPTRMAMSPDGRRIVVSHLVDRRVSVVDLETGREASVAVEDGPFGVAVGPDDRAYVTSSLGDFVSVIDTAAVPPAVIGTVKVGQGPRGVAVTPDGKRVYVANSRGRTVSVIDTSGAAPVLRTPFDVGKGPQEVAVTPDGSRAYVTVAGTTAVIHPKSGGMSDPLPFSGTSPVITPDSTRLYLLASLGYSPSSLSVVDVGTGTLVGGPLRVAAAARAVAVSPDGTRAYVVHGSGGTMSVIAIDPQPWLIGEPIPPVGFLRYPYDYAFAVRGYPAPTVTLVEGALPPGVVLSENGVLSGKPTAPGRFTFTIQASNGVGRDVRLESSIEILNLGASPASGSSGSLGSMSPR